MSIDQSSSSSERLQNDRKTSQSSSSISSIGNENIKIQEIVSKILKENEGLTPKERKILKKRAGDKPIHFKRFSGTFGNAAKIYSLAEKILGKKEGQVIMVRVHDKVEAHQVRICIMVIII